jgi:hypothetical protein
LKEESRIVKVLNRYIVESASTRAFPMQRCNDSTIQRN